METTPSPKQADSRQDKTVLPMPNDPARAEALLARLVPNAAREAADRAPAAPGRDFSAGERFVAPAIAVPPRAADVDDAASEMKPARRRPVRAFVRFLCAFSIGVAATLLWQSYGETARHLAATRFPALAWLAPPDATPPAPAAATEQPVMTLAGATDVAPLQGASHAPAMPPPALPASPETADEINAITRDLTALRQSVERLAAGQEQMSRTIARLEAAEEELKQKLATPPPPPPLPPRRPPPQAQAGSPQSLAPGQRPLSQSFAPPPARPQPRPPGTP